VRDRAETSYIVVVYSLAGNNIKKEIVLKKYILIAAAVAATTVALPGFADVGVSISVGQPGFFGQIDLGNFPQPQVVYPQPVMVETVDPNRPPIYLHVPPGYEKHWKKHCREYHACGERVFFVRDKWYQKQYVPHYQEMHRDHREAGREEHHEERHEERHDRREEERR
jgi:hypothetical protein